MSSALPGGAAATCRAQGFLALPGVTADGCRPLAPTEEAPKPCREGPLCRALIPTLHSPRLKLPTRCRRCWTMRPGQQGTGMWKVLGCSSGLRRSPNLSGISHAQQSGLKHSPATPVVPSGPGRAGQRGMPPESPRKPVAQWGRSQGGVCWEDSQRGWHYTAMQPGLCSPALADQLAWLLCLCGPLRGRARCYLPQEPSISATF